jgi:hypothetical protein
VDNSDKAKILAAFGGVKGLFDSGIPSLIFLILFNITHDLVHSAQWSLGFSALIAIYRLIKRETLQNALSGVFGVAICYWFSRSTGKAEDFYLPGLITNLVYAIAYSLSIISGWPIVGLVLGPLLGENFLWRKHPERKRVYVRASWLWVGMFVARLVVQYPLYKTGNINLLGTARVVMGYPLFIATAWGTYLIVKTVPKVEPEGSITE